MNDYNVVCLKDYPQEVSAWAQWFHSIWGISLSAYEKSMNECINSNSPVPQWYAVIDDGEIIAGLGVIENDFHERIDLIPNVCAVYVDKAYRNRGIAGKMLDFVCKDMARQGISILYLVTSHTFFYEKYGWEYYCPVLCDGENKLSRLYMKKI